MTTRPTRVNILGRDYSIDYDLDNGDVGVCEATECEIAVRDGLPLIEEQDTILHEIMHGVWEVMDIQNKKVEEFIIRKLATGLLLVLQQNPDVTKYLTHSPKLCALVKAPRKVAA